MAMTKDQIKAMQIRETAQAAKDALQRSELAKRNNKSNAVAVSAKPVLYSKAATAKPALKQVVKSAVFVDPKQIRTNLAARNRAMSKI